MGIKRTRINGLHINNLWEMEPKPLIDEIYGFFANKFKGGVSYRPKMNNDYFKKPVMLTVSFLKPITHHWK